MSETAVEQKSMLGELTSEELTALAATGESKPVEPAKPAETKAPPAPLEPQAKPAETAPASETDDLQDEGKEPQERISNRDRKIDRLTRQREHQRNLAQQYQREIAELRAQLPPSEAIRAGRDDPEPELPDLAAVGDLEEYNTALKAYTGQLKAWQSRQIETRHQKREAQRAFEQANSQLSARIERFVKTHPDFDAVTESVSLPPALQALALESEHGPALAYYLGENFGEYEKIIRLPDILQVLEAGRIIAKLSALVPEKPKLLEKPPPEPVETVGHHAGPGVIEEITPDGYLNPAWVEQHQAKMALRR